MLQCQSHWRLLGQQRAAHVEQDWPPIVPGPGIVRSAGTREQLSACAANLRRLATVQPGARSCGSPNLLVARAAVAGSICVAQAARESRLLLLASA